MKASPGSARPTLAAWSARQRFMLRAACAATRSERARSDLDPVDVLLLFVAASTPPASFRPGEVADWTGLSVRQVADAIADAEDAGRLESGSVSSGRLGLVTPIVLGALGLVGYGLAHDDVRADVRPSGLPYELSSEALAISFGLGASA
jgi:hypothetical protein